MTADLRRRVEKLEQANGTAGAEMIRLFVPRPDCPDISAWERACEAEAERDGVRSIVVRFVSPSDVRRPEGSLQ